MKITRRNLLKAGAVAAPMILTLAPTDARAYGSWSNQETRQAGSIDRLRNLSGSDYTGHDTYDRFGLQSPQVIEQRTFWSSVPYSYEWRQRKVQKEIQERWLREHYGSVGDD